MNTYMQLDRIENTTPKIIKRVTNKQSLEDRRVLAVQRYLEGETQVSIALSLKVCEKSVYNWCRGYRQFGEEGLKQVKHPGPSSKMTESQEKMVCEWLTEKTPVDFGYSSSIWSSPLICAVIKEQFNITYNSNYFCRWLKKNGFTPQMPRFVASQRNEEEIKAYPAGSFAEAVKKGVKIIAH